MQATSSGSKQKLTFAVIYFGHFVLESVDKPDAK